MHRFSLKDVESILGISRSFITGLITAGFVSPSRGARKEYRFTFQDIVILRTACGLISTRIPARKVVRSLTKLRESLPTELPLTGLRITAIGNEIAVKDGSHWHSDSGQFLLDFEMANSGGTVRLLNNSPPPPTEDSAEDWFLIGCSLEERDPSQAQIAYRKSIEKDASHIDARLNLGHLLQEDGRHAEACALYQDAIAHCPDNPILHYNLGVALEDTDRIGEALTAYADCIKLDSTFADAHYNAARLHEILGHAQQAIRHYSAYRRLQR